MIFYQKKKKREEKKRKGNSHIKIEIELWREKQVNDI